GKKLMVIPMKNQYEQHLNAAALQAMNVPVIKSLKPKYKPLIEEWLKNGQKIPVNYPDITQQIVDMVVEKHKGDATFDGNEALFI
ncbi:MAG: glycosyl transferase, partial [Chitinophagaceae bacterium]